MQDLSASAITTRLRAYWLLAVLAHCAPPPLELLPPRPFLPPPTAQNKSQVRHVPLRSVGLPLRRPCPPIPLGLLREATGARPLSRYQPRPSPRTAGFR